MHFAISENETDTANHDNAPPTKTTKPSDLPDAKDNDEQSRKLDYITSDKPADVDIMEVSPNAHPGTNIAVDDNNKENADAQVDQNPLLAPIEPVSNQNLHMQQMTESVTPSLTPNPTYTHTNQQSSAPHPGASLDEDNRDTQFTYVLRKYNTIPENRVYSSWHIFGGYKWRLLIFPRGNHTSNNDLSVYLECGGPYAHDDVSQQSSSNFNNLASSNGKDMAIITAPPTSWNRHAKFSLHLVHPSSLIAKSAVNSEEPLTDPSLVDLDITDSNTGPRMQSNTRSDMVKETSHTFRPNVSDWGFLEFAPFSSLQPNSYADDEMNVVIMVKIRLQDQTVDPSFTNTAPWDSRRETGLVGFKNQGATCYMNSLLQTLYMLSAFRKAVYNMPLPEEGNENAGSELSYALQKVFYELQFSPNVVKTKKLTESFGWDTTDAFTQHDVQELKLILCDELAEKMKKICPDQPNTLSTLFLGNILNYIECIDVNYKSTREEEFSDLSLNVKGCRDIYQSFEKYVEVEMMEGDNKYRADGYEELQNARKGVKFLKLPPVLQLHLKRFEYDTTRDAMVKINDRYEFDTEIDLSRFVEDSDGDDIYLLHSVLVHIGDVNGGHYHAFIRPVIELNEDGTTKPSQWYKFDDETVTKAQEEAAVQENFGVGGEREFSKRGIDDDLGNGGLNGQTNPPSVFPNRGRNYQPRRFSNAYMLQYLRKSDIKYLLALPKDEDVPEALAERIRKEREEEEQRKRDNTEKHLYLNTLVANDSDMVKHHEADLVNWMNVRQLCVKRAMKLGELKLLLQKEVIIPDARRVRLWKCGARHNQMIRPDSLVADGDDSKPIDTNARDPHTGLTVPLYQTRHGYYGQDDAVRLYAEDLSSKYCLSAGVAYSKYLQMNGENNVEAKEEMELSVDEKTSIKEKMETEVVANDYSSWSFPLKSGRETLLFVKYYSSRPHAWLQWLGHIVVDKATKVKDLEPLLRDAVEAFRKEDSTLTPLSSASKLRIFEEEFPTEVKELEDHLTLSGCQISAEGGNGDIIVFQEDVKSLSNLDENELALKSEFEDGVVKHNNSERDEWDGYQEMSKGDGTDLPLGGRPLPLVSMYYEYMANRVKIEFKDKQTFGEVEEIRSIFFELSRKDTYRTARKVLSGALPEQVNPDYIRFFVHDYTREAPASESFRISSDDMLERVIPMHTIMSTGQPDYRTIWYEVTEYHISEFEHKEEVRVVWRPDCGTRSTGYISKGGNNSHTNCASNNNKNNVEMKDVSDGNTGTDMSLDGDEEKNDSGVGVGENGEVEVDDSLSGSRPHGDGKNGEVAEKCSKSFSVLVPLSSKFADVIQEIRIKRNVPSDVGIRMFEVKHSRITKFITNADSVPSLLLGGQEYGIELRAEPIPEDETKEVLGDEYDLVMVVHLAKQSRKVMVGPLSLFGQPFVIKVRKVGETVDTLRKRIQDKLGVPSEEFDSWAFAEICHQKVVVLDQGDQVYKPRRTSSIEFSALAIEHKSTASPKRTSSTISRYSDKPLKIRS